jgi:hypothetical protein
MASRSADTAKSLFERFDRVREDGTAAGEAAARRQMPAQRASTVRLTSSDDSPCLLSTRPRSSSRHAGVSDERDGTTAKPRMEVAYLEWSAVEGRSDCAAACGSCPDGLVNEWHEPPFVIGTHRPRRRSGSSSPTTWSANRPRRVRRADAGPRVSRRTRREGLDANGSNTGRPKASVTDARAVAQAKATHPAFSRSVDSSRALRSGWSAVTGYAGKRVAGMEQTGGAENRTAPRSVRYARTARLSAFVGSRRRCSVTRIGTPRQTRRMICPNATGTLRRSGSASARGSFGGYVEASYDLLDRCSQPGLALRDRARPRAGKNFGHAGRRAERHGESGESPVRSSRLRPWREAAFRT